METNKITKTTLISTIIIKSPGASRARAGVLREQHFVQRVRWQKLKGIFKSYTYDGILKRWDLKQLLGSGLPGIEDTGCYYGVVIKLIRVVMDSTSVHRNVVLGRSLERRLNGVLVEIRESIYLSKGRSYQHLFKPRLRG